MDQILIGWREWLSLPELNISKIKAKIDTGARTSSLHAFFVDPFMLDGQKMVRFGVHPLRKSDLEIICQCPFIDYREIRDSGGHREMRYVIETQIKLGEHVRTVEITLTNRDNMKFRMLLGRTALRGMAIIPDQSYLFGRPKSMKVRNA
jgi:hypothetical protein